MLRCLAILAESITIIETSKRDWLDYATFGIGVILAGVTLAGVWAAWRGLPELKKQAAAAKDAAIATKEAVDLSRKTAKRQLRAYMVLRRGGLFLLDGDALKLTLEVKNSGQTPAYEIRGRVDCGFSSYPILEPLRGNQPFESNVIVGGGHAFKTGDIIPFTQTDIEALRGDEKRAFFIVGKYTYLDIFKEHRVRFQLFVGGPGGVQFDTDGSGNKFYVAYPDAVGNEGD